MPKPSTTSRLKRKGTCFAHQVVRQTADPRTAYDVVCFTACQTAEGTDPFRSGQQEPLLKCYAQVDVDHLCCPAINLHQLPQRHSSRPCTGMHGSSRGLPAVDEYIVEVPITQADDVASHGIYSGRPGVG